MTENAKQAWGEVGERFASWGQRVADRYHEAEGSPEAAEASAGDFERSAKELIDEIGRGVTAFTKTLKDDAANQELSAAVGAIGDAIKATVDEARQGMRSGGGPDRPEGEA
jgi:hypothetical protein